MTTIKTDSPLRRETAATVRRRGKERPLIAEAHAGYVSLWPKGLKGERYSIDWTAVYHAAAKVAARGE